MDLLKEYFIHYLQGSINLVGLFEFGTDKGRYDLMILHAHKQHFRGFEFKRTRSDFLRDLRSGKWTQYLDYCNTFTWVCPYGLIQPDIMIPEDYNVTFNDPDTNPITIQELSNQATKYSDYECIIALGGKTYSNIVRELFKDKQVIPPTYGLPIGKAMSKVKNAIESNIPFICPEK